MLTAALIQSSHSAGYWYAIACAEIPLQPLCLPDCAGSHCLQRKARHFGGLFSYLNIFTISPKGVLL
jgi:hypothetical protein